MRALRRAVIGSVVAAALACVAAAVWIAWPVPTSMTAIPASGSTEIRDKGGLLLRTVRSADGKLAEWTPYARIDVDIINAFVAVEDRRFWTHHGIDALAVLRAVRDNMSAGQTTSGASTISMQTARMLTHSGRGLH
jgi:penicillin-binding protein 1C